MIRYSPEFKIKALSLMKEVGISKASSELHVTRATLCRWRAEESVCCMKPLETVCPGFSYNDPDCLLRKYLEQSAQLNESILILEGRLDQLQAKAKRLSDMNKRLVTMLSSRPAENNSSDSAF